MEADKKLNGKMYEDKVRQPTNGFFKKRLTNLKAEFKLDWKTIKEQLSIDMLRFGKFLKRLLVTDKK